MQGNPALPQGIEGVVMGKVYYNRMRKAAFALACAALVGMLTVAMPQQLPQSTPIRASVLDSHEGMTIGAEPLTTLEQYKPAFPKKNPFASGVIAIRVMFRNETSESIRVNISRIRLSLRLEDESRCCLRFQGKRSKQENSPAFSASLVRPQSWPRQELDGVAKTS